MGAVKSLICSFTTALLVVAVSLIPLTAVAGTGTFGSYIGVDVGDGGGNVWYGGTQPGSTTLDSFDGKDLGDFTVGDSMLISGGELLTWKSDGGDVTGATLHYSVYEASASPVTWNQMTINWASNSPFNDAAGNNFSGGGDQKWANPTSTPDVLSGVGSGDYNLAVYFEASTSEGARYDSNGGNNFISTFSVVSSAVPEPSAFFIALGGFLSLALLRRKRKR